MDHGDICGDVGSSFHDFGVLPGDHLTGIFVRRGDRCDDFAPVFVI